MNDTLPTLAGSRPTTRGNDILNPPSILGHVGVDTREVTPSTPVAPARNARQEPPLHLRACRLVKAPSAADQWTARVTLKI